MIASIVKVTTSQSGKSVCFIDCVPATLERYIGSSATSRETLAKILGKVQRRLR